MPQAKIEEQFVVRTIDATPANVVQYTPPEESMSYIILTATAKCSDGGRAILESEYGTERTGGAAPTILGTSSKTAWVSGSGNRCSLGLAIVGNELQFQVTGDAGLTVDWGINSDIQTVTYFPPA